MSSSQTGKQGELFAQKFLQKKGHKILGTNYRSRFGEIDIISSKSKQIVFTEVKTRSSKLFGRPSEFVTEEKLEKLTKTAHIYLEKELKKSTSVPCRFDVIEVYFDFGKLARISHLENVTL